MNCFVQNQIANHCNQPEEQTFNDLLRIQKDEIIECMVEQILLDGERSFDDRQERGETEFVWSCLSAPKDVRRMSYSRAVEDLAESETAGLIIEIAFKGGDTKIITRTHIEAIVKDYINQALTDFDRAPDNRDLIDFMPSLSNAA